MHKPTRGERPLDDFPYGTLAARERAAYLLSEASGWQIVPPTVAAQRARWARAWSSCGSRSMTTSTLVDLINDADPRLRRIALFDAIANNADRKVVPLALPGGLIQGVDHGICFAVAQDAHGAVGLAR